jgi:hypothetical protein
MRLTSVEVLTLLTMVDMIKCIDWNSAGKRFIFPDFKFFYFMSSAPHAWEENIIYINQNMNTIGCISQIFKFLPNSICCSLDILNIVCLLMFMIKIIRWNCCFSTKDSWILTAYVMSFARKSVFLKMHTCLSTMTT